MRALQFADLTFASFDVYRGAPSQPAFIFAKDLFVDGRFLFHTIVAESPRADLFAPLLEHLRLI